EVDPRPANARARDRLTRAADRVSWRLAPFGPVLGAQQVRHQTLELGELSLHGLEVPRHEGRVPVHGGERIAELVHRGGERVFLRASRAAEGLDIAAERVR